MAERDFTARFRVDRTKQAESPPDGRRRFEERRHRNMQRNPIVPGDIVDVRKTSSDGKRMKNQPHLVADVDERDGRREMELVPAKIHDGSQRARDFILSGGEGEHAVRTSQDVRFDMGNRKRMVEDDGSIDRRGGAVKGRLDDEQFDRMLRSYNAARREEFGRSPALGDARRDSPPDGTVPPDRRHEAERAPTSPENDRNGGRARASGRIRRRPAEAEPEA